MPMTTLQMLSFFIVPVSAVLIGLAGIWWLNSLNEPEPKPESGSPLR